MPRDAVRFPEGSSPFDEPDLLIDEARAVYERAGCPEGFVVCGQTQDDYSVIFYFSTVASGHCADLFKSYKVTRYDEPLPSSKPLTQLIP
jgi:hypothetical protein